MESSHTAGIEGSVYTDLVLEAQELRLGKEKQKQVPGVHFETKETGSTSISRMSVENLVGAKALGKAPGNYSTLECKALREHNKEVQEELGSLLARELQWFFEQAGLSKEDTILLVGLGNHNATPDALGPRVVERVLVTRHLLSMSPPELRGGLTPVAALAPGVLGLTGIETGEIIQAVAEKLPARALVCVDALASRSVERLCTTIQISDTGIHPGAGVGNKRMPINKESMGIPVIAIGVPTVVYASTIVEDALSFLENQSKNGETRIDPALLKEPLSSSGFASKVRQEAIAEVLKPYLGRMIVTPKEIDLLLADITQVIAGGLNVAFHEGVDYDEVFQYLT